MCEPEPLTSEEIERLRRWERQTTRFHAAAMAVLLLVAAILQMRERCPRCRAHLRTKTLMRRPDRCSMCGVAFEAPRERADDA